MKSFALLFSIKVNVILYEIFTLAGCAPLHVLNSEKPRLPPSLFNTNYSFINDGFQTLTNFVQPRPELNVHFDFPLPMHHPPRPPPEYHDHIMQHNYRNDPVQPHLRPALNENRNSFKNAPNSFQQPKYDEENYNKEADNNDKFLEKEITTTTLEPSTSDYTTETTTDYETSTIDDDDLFLRSAVPDAVAATLLG